MENSLILSDPEVMSGMPCFRGTRVPAKSLFDYLESGHTLDDFLLDFPSVTREQSLSAIQASQESFAAASPKISDEPRVH